MLTSVSWDSGETMLYHSEQNMLPHTEQSCSKRGAKVHLDGTEWLKREAQRETGSPQTAAKGG